MRRTLSRRASPIDHVDRRIRPQVARPAPMAGSIGICCWCCSSRVGAVHFLARLSAGVPADTTQTTISVSLLAPPPAADAEGRADKPAPRPRPRNAPTITPSSSAPAPEPLVEPPAEPPPEPAPVPPTSRSRLLLYRSRSSSIFISPRRGGVADQGPHCLSNFVHTANRHPGADVCRLVDRSGAKRLTSFGYAPSIRRDCSICGRPAC